MMPYPKPEIRRPKHSIPILVAKHKTRPPRIYNASDNIIDNFLPILSAIIPDRNDPIVAVRIAKLTND